MQTCSTRSQCRPFSPQLSAVGSVRERKRVRRGGGEREGGGRERGEREGGREEEGERESERQRGR